MAIVGGDLRIGLVVDELVAGIDVGAADDDDVKGAAVFLLVEGPGGGALGVAGGEVRGERGAAEGDRVAVVKDAVDLRRREATSFYRQRNGSRLWPPDSTTETSCAITSYFAPVRRLISALPAQWS